MRGRVIITEILIIPESREEEEEMKDEDVKEEMEA